MQNGRRAKQPKVCDDCGLQVQGQACAVFPIRLIAAHHRPFGEYDAYVFAQPAMAAAQLHHEPHRYLVPIPHRAALFVHTGGDGCGAICAKPPALRPPASIMNNAMNNKNNQ